MFARKKFNNRYEAVMEPFKIIGNVYFVGNYLASSHLIDTKDGLILIDTGYEDTLFLLINSIYQLGFSPYDIKLIIHTHWHGDHTGATLGLASLTGAKTYIGKKDEKNVKRYFEPDYLLEDKDKISLGNTTIDIIETPGHTKGTISLFFKTKESNIEYKVGMFGGAGANTLTKERAEYENCRQDYKNSLDILREKEVDVFIGNHVWNNDTYNKSEILRKTGENLFIDNKLWNKFLDFCEERLNQVIANDK